MFIKTDLKTLNGMGVLEFSYDDKLLEEAHMKLSDARAMPDTLFLLDCIDSARIEGYYAQYSDVIFGAENKETKIVHNLVKAGGMLKTVSDMCIPTLQALWSVVIDLVCENTSAGADGFRSGMVFVSNGSYIAHMPADPEMISPMLSSMLDYTTGDAILDAIVKHFYFEYIHPFCDGNGRIGRLLCEHDLGTLIPLSKSISCRRPDYYAYLKSMDGNRVSIDAFVEYMLQRIIVATNIASLDWSVLEVPELTILSKVDRYGYGDVSKRTAQIMLGDRYDAPYILLNLANKGFLIKNEFDYHIAWR